MKLINLKTFEKDRNPDIQDKIKVLYKLGYDFSSNRKQGKIYVTYNPTFSRFETGYRTYKNENVKAGKIEYETFTHYLNITQIVKQHYNCQSSKNRNRTSRRFKNCTNDIELLKKINKIDKINALSRHPRTSILALDIDNHKDAPEYSLEAFKYIISKYYGSIVYTEISQDIGFHMFINFNTMLNHQKLKEIQTKIKKDGFDNIEVIGADNNKQLLRFIDSPHYIPIDYNEDLSEMVELSEEDYMNQILTFDSNEQELYENSIIKIEKPIEGVNEGVNIDPNVPIWGRRELSSTNKYKPKEEIIEELKTKYPYGAGERVDYMYKIASACGFYNLDEQDFIDICLSNNYGSNDLSIWDINKIEYIYKKFYAWFLTQHDFKQYNNKYDVDFFISNKSSLKDNQNIITQQAIELLTQNLLKTYILPTLKYKKHKDEYKRITPLLIKELIGFIVYNENNPKTRYSGSVITTEKFNQVNQGFQFTRKQLNLFKKNHNTYIDIHKLFNIIIKNSIFSQIYHNKSGYCFNPLFKFSRQFKLTLSFKKTNNIYYKIIKNIIYLFNKLKEDLIITNTTIDNNMLKVLINASFGFLLELDFEVFEFT